MLLTLCKKQDVQVNLDGTPDVIAENIVDAVNNHLCNIFGDGPEIDHDLDNQRIFIHPAKYADIDIQQRPTFVINLNAEYELKGEDHVNFDVWLSRPIENYLTSKTI